LEISDSIDSEGIDIMFVGETGLRGLEKPPEKKGFVWEGENRQDGEKKGGGIGFWCRDTLSGVTVHKKCKEHMWMVWDPTGKQDQRVWIGGVYMGREGLEQEWNDDMFRCMEKDIGEMEGGRGEIIIMGDWNARIN